MKALSVAIEAALAGGAILKSYYGGAFRVAFKGELDLVTQADTESEAQVLSILRARLPDVSILAEESGVSDRDTAQRFIVDPLDGTTNFAHAYPMFAVSIGYEEDGRVRAGVVYDPIREELFTAEQGRGAFLNGSKLHVSTTDRIEHSLLVTGFPYDLKDDLEGNLRLFERFMGIARAIRRDGSAALDLCYVAAGRFDGFWEEKLGPWDTAAGALIVEEAGGRVTDLRGGTFHYTQKGVVASNGRIQERMLSILS
jgi:myo-inositol-1(or 4)-monophosphatase